MLHANGLVSKYNSMSFLQAITYRSLALLNSLSLG